MRNERDDRQLPHSLEGERGLLGAIMTHNDFMFDVMEIITAQDFYEPANGEIFKLMQDMIGANRTASPLTLLTDMTQDRDIGGIRASEYLRQLLSEGLPGGVEEAKEAARGIADNALGRRLIGIGRQMIDDVFNRPPSMGAAYLRDRYDVEFGSAFPALKEFGIRHMKDFGDSVLHRIDETFKTDVDAGMALGLVEVQNLIGPLLPGRLYSLAGASGSGKSVMAQQWGEYITQPTPDPADQKVGLLIQAEMEGEENAARAMTARTTIAGERIERAKINDSEFQKLMDANADMGRGSLYIDAGTSPSVARIRAKAVRMKRSRGLHVLIVDQLLFLARESDRMNDIETIPPNMRALKAIAKDLGIPVVILMPLKSAYHEGDVRPPRMSDLTHPAAIDQISDVILFIDRPEAILGKNEPAEDDKDHAEWESKMMLWEGKANAILMKRRGGIGHGKRRLFFNKSTVRFTDNSPSPIRNDGPAAFDFGGT